jgi:hypothetical protein
MFLAPKKHHPNTTNSPRIHHKLTTFLPSQNTQKPQNPSKKPLFPLLIFPAQKIKIREKYHHLCLHAADREGR